MAAPRIEGRGDYAMRGTGTRYSGGNVPLLMAKVSGSDISPGGTGTVHLCDDDWNAIGTPPVDNTGIINELDFTLTAGDKALLAKAGKKWRIVGPPKSGGGSSTIEYHGLLNEALVAPNYATDVPTTVEVVRYEPATITYNLIPVTPEQLDIVYNHDPYATAPGGTYVRYTFVDGTSQLKFTYISCGDAREPE